MTNIELRSFFEELTKVVESHPEIPIEAKRLALFTLFELVERQANEAIVLEQEEALNAEDLLKNKLGELSVGSDSAQ